MSTPPKYRVTLAGWGQVGKEMNAAAASFRTAIATASESARVALDRWKSATKPIVEDAKRILSVAQASVRAVAEARSNAVAIQSRFLRAGYVPSVSLMAWRDSPETISIEDAAAAYERALRADGIDDIADLMKCIPAISELGRVHALRAIFPEIERMVREDVYEQGASDRIARLTSLRIVANMLVHDIPLGKLPERLLESDFFIATCLGALDYSYASDGRFRTHQCVFRKVPVRNLVVHGVDISYEDVHVVNAMTVLFVAARIATLLRKLGIRIPVEPKAFSTTVEHWKRQRRAGNNTMRRLFRSKKR